MRYFMCLFLVTSEESVTLYREDEICLLEWERSLVGTPTSHKAAPENQNLVTPLTQDNQTWC